MNITLNKARVQQIDSKRMELGAKQNIVLNRQEMVDVLLQKGIETFEPQFSEKSAAGMGTDRPGVLCFGGDGSFILLGALHRPEPEECVRVLKKDGALLMVIFGEPGCGVTTLIRAMQSLGLTDVYVCVQDQTNAATIPQGLAAFLVKNRGIRAMTARSAEAACRTLNHHF